MNIDDLQKYSDAWNKHDIDTIMSYMTQDCIFETGGGSEQYGTRFAGFEAVRNRFIEVWTDIPNVRFENTSHFIQGTKACSEWTFTGTSNDGTQIEIDGCDIFTLESGKIKSKRSYLKNRS